MNVGELPFKNGYIFVSKKGSVMVSFYLRRRRPDANESMRRAESTLAIKKTASELMIDDVEFPIGFEPRYVAMDESTCWHAFQEKPVYRRDAGEWRSTTLSSYELGIDDTESQEFTPAFARGLPPEDSLFEVAACSLS